MATVEQVTAAYPAQTVDVDDAAIEALLAAAEELVAYTIKAPYVAGNIHINDAIEKAVIHQTGMWLDLGDTGDLAGYPEGSVIEISGYKFPVPATVAPRALRALRMAGLLRPYGA